MKNLLISTVSCFGVLSSLHAETKQETLSAALFAEESEQNHQAALEKYQSILDKYKKDRQTAALALFRIAEIHNKKGNTKVATSHYRRLLIEFPNIEPQARLSREKLLHLGEKIPAQKTFVADQETHELERLRTLQVTSPDAFKDPQNLETAAKNNWIKAVTFLLANNIDINNSTALVEASRNGHLAICKLLLEAGADPNGSNQDALPEAFLAGHTKTIKLLLEHGANVKGDNGHWVPAHVTKRTPLNHIKLLFEAGYDISTYNYKTKVRIGNDQISGGSLLHRSITERDSDELFYYLMEHNPDVNQEVVTAGLTSLHLAVLEGDIKMVNTLLKAGANVHVRGSHRLKVIDVSKKRPSNWIRLRHETPLSLAVQANYLDKAKALIAAGSHLPADALYHAIDADNPEMVKLLLDKGATANPKVSHLSSLMAHAFNNGNNPEIVNLLIERGTFFDQQTLTNVKPELQVELMRAHFYPQFAKRKGVTLVIPEAQWDKQIQQAVDNKAIAKDLYLAEIPTNTRITKQSFSVRIADMDQMECSIYRNGKKLSFSLQDTVLPTFADGDIIELSNFSQSEKAQRKHAQNKVFRTGRSPHPRPHSVATSQFGHLIGKYIDTKSQ